MTYYGWYHATVLLDSRSNTVFYRDAGNFLKEYARAVDVPFDMEIYVVDGRSRSDESFLTALLFAKQTSRGMGNPMGPRPFPEV